MYNIKCNFNVTQFLLMYNMNCNVNVTREDESKNDDKIGR